MNEIENHALQIIDRYFELEHGAEIRSIPEIQKFLTERINFLLVHDFEKLIEILYRIDVNEQKVKEALAAGPDPQPAAILANLVIARQIKKAQVKFQHKKEKGDW